VLALQKGRVLFQGMPEGALEATQEAVRPKLNTISGATWRSSSHEKTRQHLQR
jgi:hypothetical protein